MERDDELDDKEARRQQWKRHHQERDRHEPRTKQKLLKGKPRDNDDLEDFEEESEDEFNEQEFEDAVLADFAELEQQGFPPACTLCGGGTPGIE